MPSPADRDRLRALFTQVRRLTEALCEPLAIEDYVVQTMPDASPTKWHLAHTSWFFETFVLARAGGYVPFDERYAYLFNSYYHAAGERHPQAQRGALSRPTVAEVLAYRRHLDRAMRHFFETAPAALFTELAFVVELGINHEEQHQELIVTDMKHVLASNPLAPAYISAQLSPPARIAAVVDPARTSSASDAPASTAPGVRAIGAASVDTVVRAPGAASTDTVVRAPGAASTETDVRGSGSASAGSAPIRWVLFDGGVAEIGAPAAGFAFDNERPRHRALLAPFELASRPASCGEYADFIADRGYERSELWLSDGWDACQRQGWRAPLYWQRTGAAWTHATLHGAHAIDPAEPVCHVSYYEADAFARWAGARLPLEAEWEHAAATCDVAGNLLDSGRLHPAPAPATAPRLAQLFGDVWEWTASPYQAYPGYEPFAGVLGEYNGKFMINRMVLRGGSCATPARHIRASYRNFFLPDARWQFAGIRLAR